MRGSSVAKGVLLTAAGAICWGFSGTCAQLLMDIYGVPLAWNVCVRLVFASLLYLVFCAATHREQLLCLLKQPRELGRLLAFSIFGVLLVQVCYQGCISVSNAGTATVFERCGLILIMLITCVKARRAPMRRELLGVVLAIVGTICIATKGNLGMLAIPAEALMWGAASACALVFYTMMPVHLLERWGSVVTTTVSMTMAAIIANAVVQPWNMHVEVTPSIVAAMAALVIIGTFFAYLLFLQGVKLAGPMRAGLVGSIEPVAAMAFSTLWLGTPITPFDIAGCALIVIMVLLVTQREEEAPREVDLSSGDAQAVEVKLSVEGARVADSEPSDKSAQTSKVELSGKAAKPIFK